jgi:AcrR family transcriptional regulator
MSEERPSLQTRSGQLRWVREPRQARSRRTLDRILDAAEALMAEKGFEDAPVAEVVRRAGSSVGAFYARFRDKDGLLYALYDRYLEQAMATTDDALDPARWEGVALPETLGSVVRFLVSVFREQRGLIRAFVMRNHADPGFAAREARLSRYVGEKLAGVLLAHRDAIRHPEPERAVRFGLNMVFSTIESMVLFGETRSSDLAVDDDRLAAELTRAYLAYLGVTERQNPTPDRSAP